MARDKRDQKVATTVTDAEKQDVRVRAARQGKNISEYIRDLVYDDLEQAGYETSRDEDLSEGNPSPSSGRAD
jgi:hypothetical protein